MRGFTVRGSESPRSKASFVQSSREGADPVDEIVESGRSPLDPIVRDGARRMLQAALESEVDASLERHAVVLDECNRRVVRNGYLPTREIATDAGILEASQPRVRDKASIGDERIVFSSKILSPYLRKSQSVEELIPWLDLKGVSAGVSAMQREIGRQFFEDNRAGKAVDWMPFIKGQEKDKLPDGWDADRRSIVIFNSSEQ
jgi:hypothetical protein